MRRLFAALLLLASAALAANVKLYLKDGGYHIVREYRVQQDRVHFYSVERSEWEDIPLALVDLKRTEAEIAANEAAVKEDAKMVTAEEKVEREQEREMYRIPRDPGVYQLIDGKQLRVLSLAESKVHSNKRRSVLKALSPVPLVSGKATLELDGLHSNYNVESDTPEFYIQLSAEQTFGIVRLTPEKEVRIVEKITIIPVTKEMVEEPQEVEIFRRQLGSGDLYKIWPQKPIEPGEYAVVEYTPGKMNMQIWDFTWQPGVKWTPPPAEAAEPAAPHK